MWSFGLGDGTLATLTPLGDFQHDCNNAQR
jgi:hypothetical protein